MHISVESKDLSQLNTLGLPAIAHAYAAYTQADQLPALSQLCKSYPSVFVMGGGSNVVLAPVLPGLVIHARTSGIELVDETDDAWFVQAQAGEVWHDFVQACLDRGWPGLENLALIPGTVGAAPVQNIGAYGVELDTRVERVSAWDLHEGRLKAFSREQCQFAYRDSFFKRQPQGRWLITQVCFRLPKQWAPVLDYPDLAACRDLRASAGLTAQQVFDAVCVIRRTKLPDPAVLGNAGSFFKNPVVDAAEFHRLKTQYADLVAYPQAAGGYKLAAGWLIDRAGWKGRRVGPVGVHERQALVLVNFGGATAADVNALADSIRRDVFGRFGVALEQEPVKVC